MLGEVSAWSVSRAAYAAAVFNLIAAATMLFLLEPGLPLEGSAIESRQAWVASHRGVWWTGWIAWQAAAISLLGLYVGLAGLWRERAPILSTLALLVAAAGLAADLGAEAIYMGVLPGLARDGYATAELTGSIFTGYLGNGLYTLAGAMLTVVGRRDLPRTLVALGCLVWTLGAWLSGSALVQSSWGMFWSTATLMPTFVLWTILLGRWLARRGAVA